VHLLNAKLSTRAHPATGAGPATAVSTEPAASTLQPVEWATIFGPDADPDLISDAKQGLSAILGEAREAKLSFNVKGESALAARFDSADAANVALNRYGGFFQFSEASGSDADGWTARRYQGQGEWNHVVAAGNELYAWTGATRDRVVAHRVRALGAMAKTPVDTPTVHAHRPGEPATDWLRQRPTLLAAFIVINVVMAALWFFKASAWSTREAAHPGIPAIDAVALRGLLLKANDGSIPITVSQGNDGETLEVNWRYADGRWFDLMRVHQMRRTQKLVLQLDAAAGKLRVREYWSAFDASAGSGNLKLDWKTATGVQFFQIERSTVVGLQFDPAGQPTGEWIKTFTFDGRVMKLPLIEIATSNGWDWQPVMWDGPKALRWLTE